jgi:hypothetical protein
MPHRVPALLVAFLAIICSALSLLAQQIPPSLQPPAGEQLFLTLHAKGDQVYTCKEGATRVAWMLKQPDAQLFDKDGKPFGKHFAGPTWEANDGSRVIGQAAADAPSPDPNSIPWLLVHVVRHEGNDGVLSRASAIQRINTQGGKAPESGCDSTTAGREIRVPYTADYLFYTPK